jgi:hypothetical protein
LTIKGFNKIISFLFVICGLGLTIYIINHDCFITPVEQIDTYSKLVNIGRVT